MRSEDIMREAPAKVSFTKVGPMDERHWGMILLGLVLGLGASFATVLPIEVRILAWVVGLVVTYYSGSWPATAKRLVKYRPAATTVAIVIIAVSMIYELRGFENWEVFMFLDAAIGRTAAIAFVAIASQILVGNVRGKIKALHHGIVLFEGHNVNMLVEEGDPIFSIKGFTVQEQQNETLQDERTAEVEVGGVVGVKVKFFTETDINRVSWGPEGQVHWALGAQAAADGFLSSAETILRKIASEAFPSGSVKEFKLAVNGPFILWVKWILATDEDPREDADLVRGLGWTNVDENGHVRMEDGISFFRRHEIKLKRELKGRMRGQSETERQFGRNFVGKICGITDVIAPKEVEAAFSRSAEIRSMAADLAEIPKDRLELLLAAGGHVEYSIRDIRGLEGSNAVIVEGAGAGVGAILGRGGKNKKKGSGGGTGHGGGHA